jgi:hypothetical protein
MNLTSTLLKGVEKAIREYQYDTHTPENNVIREKCAEYIRWQLGVPVKTPKAGGGCGRKFFVQQWGVAVPRCDDLGDTFSIDSIVLDRVSRCITALIEYKLWANESAYKDYKRLVVLMDSAEQKLGKQIEGYVVMGGGLISNPIVRKDYWKNAFAHFTNTFRVPITEQIFFEKFDQRPHGVAVINIREARTRMLQAAQTIASPMHRAARSLRLDVGGPDDAGPFWISDLMRVASSLGVA